MEQDLKCGRDAHHANSFCARNYADLIMPTHLGWVYLYLEKRAFCEKDMLDFNEILLSSLGKKALEQPSRLFGA
jgi:hypothetical protein